MLRRAGRGSWPVGGLTAGRGSDLAGRRSDARPAHASSCASSVNVAARHFEAIVEFARLGVSVIPRGLQVGEGRGSIVAGEFDQGAVVMDHPAGFASRGRGERPAEVGGGVGITPRRIVEDAAVECGAGELVVALEGARVIAQGLVGPTQCLVGQRPVVVALGRVVGQRDADAEGVEQRLRIGRACRRRAPGRSWARSPAAGDRRPAGTVGRRGRVRRRGGRRGPGRNAPRPSAAPAGTVAVAPERGGSSRGPCRRRGGAVPARGPSPSTAAASSSRASASRRASPASAAGARRTRRSAQTVTISSRSVRILCSSSGSRRPGIGARSRPRASQISRPRSSSVRASSDGCGARP